MKNEALDPTVIRNHISPSKKSNVHGEHKFLTNKIQESDARNLTFNHSSTANCLLCSLLIRWFSSKCPNLKTPREQLNLLNKLSLLVNIQDRRKLAATFCGVEMFKIFWWAGTYSPAHGLPLTSPNLRTKIYYDWSGYTLAQPGACCFLLASLSGRERNQWNGLGEGSTLISPVR